MIEKIYNYELGNEKIIEKLVNDDNVVINHMTLPKDTALPVHYSNSHVYMIIVRGTMNIALGDQEAHEYKKGDIINIPFNIKMDVKNLKNEVLEFFVIKAPNPKEMEK